MVIQETATGTPSPGARERSASASARDRLLDSDLPLSRFTPGEEFDLASQNLLSVYGYSVGVSSFLLAIVIAIYSGFEFLATNDEQMLMAIASMFLCSQCFTIVNMSRCPATQLGNSPGTPRL